MPGKKGKKKLSPAQLAEQKRLEEEERQRQEEERLRLEVSTPSPTIRGDSPRDMVRIWRAIADPSRVVDP